MPTVIWLDEAGRVARPADVAFADDRFLAITNRPSAPHHEALRRWVTGGQAPLDEDEVRARQMVPSTEEQQARVEWLVAVHLHRAGRAEAAERHFRRAGELAPDDFTIRRGSMLLRGQDPFGADFFELSAEWTARGRPYYVPREEK